MSISRPIPLAMVGLLTLCCLTSSSWAQSTDRFSAAGYFRVMARPDLQGGDGQLGYSTLYGRLLNERPYGLLELRLQLVPQEPGSDDVWTLVNARVEGGSVANADIGGGALGNFRLSQLYAQAGNVLFDNVTWQLGTLNTFYGDLGLYDFRLAELFGDTVGLSARYQRGPVDVLVAVGDAGYQLRGREYNTVVSAGGTARLGLGQHFQLGVGVQGYYEPKVEGNRFAPYNTPDVDYEDFVRGRVAQRFLEENPGMGAFFPDPEATSADSFKAVAYVGFGGLGPLTWSSLYANFLRRHPQQRVTENTASDGSFDIYIKSLTDERYQFNIGNEMLLTLWPGRLDAVWSVFFGRHWDKDNNIKPTESDRAIFSTVGRLQFYLSETVHLLGESSVAHERSIEGNLFRNHYDSVFQSTSGVSDSEGLEYGDSDVRNTWQGKFGVVLNPVGTGIYTRPSLRVLYGLQHSTQNNAFGNNFVDSLDEFDDFKAQEVHWHHVLSLEAEAWF